MDDHKAIEALIERQFNALSWDESRDADWSGFANDFVDGAQLFASARPVKSQSVDQFVDRMQGISKSSLPDLQERFLGRRIEVYGNVAVAMAVCELTENKEKVSCNIEALLLVKEDGQWRIASQAWDTAKDVTAAQELWSDPDPSSNQ